MAMDAQVQASVSRAELPRAQLTPAPVSMARSQSAETPVRRRRSTGPRGIVRPQAPGTILLSPVRQMGGFLPSPRSQRVPSPHLQQAPSPGAIGASSSGAISPLLTLANDLPDDPEEASQLVNLFAQPPPLNPAWSPLSRSASVRSTGAGDDPSPYFPPVTSRPRSMGRTPARMSSSALGLSPMMDRRHVSPPTPSRVLSPQPTHHASNTRSPEPNIFERDIEARSATNLLLTPTEAIEAAVPPVLDDAASAIVEHTPLEIVAPRSPAPVSPTQTERAFRARHESAGTAAHDSQQRYGRVRGHRRPLSDASHLTTRSPASPQPSLLGTPHRAAAPLPPTPGRLDPLGPSMSPSLSIDGAIIAENNAATAGHSLDGLADAFAHMGHSRRREPRVRASVPPTGLDATTRSPMTPQAAAGFHSPEDQHAPFRYTVMGTMPTSPSAAPTDAPARLAPSPKLVSPSSKRSPRLSTAFVMRDAASTDSLGDHLQVPSAAARLSPERKRLSFMAYTDIVHDVDEQHMGLEQARLA